ncbi:MAG: SRPBCC domain-containing protein [Thermomicrobia bacterium]|nr:SRPBCC domain-containing protein [Thermomicrobia bacterium]
MDPPHRVVFTWDERPQSACLTTSAFTLTAEGNGTRVHLVHSGFGSGAARDRLFDNINGWNSERGKLRIWLENGTPQSH